ncbi:MAG: hypothetical protein IM607_12345 [Cytophagales bacterium]|nr:hypothetical protein [Cytophagales bacterium]
MPKIDDQCGNHSNCRHTKPDWDGYGAEPINQDSLALMREFLDTLPDKTLSPGFGSGGEAEIDFYVDEKLALVIEASTNAELVYFAFTSFFSDIPQTDIIPRKIHDNGTVEFILPEPIKNFLMEQKYANT